MSFYTKPVSQIDAADLQALLTDNAVENVRLEFKLEVPSKDETLKKLSSFANTFGGFMVVGARGNSADGRLTELPGVAVESGYKQKIVQWCFDGASPPLMVEVSDPIPVTAGDGNVCYVVRTAESEVAPHFLNGRKGVYVRTDEFSARFEARLANEMELRHLLDRRRLVRERRAGLVLRARQRFSTYAKRKYAEVIGGSGSLGPRLDLCICPRFPAQPLCDQATLIQFVMREAISWRRTRFPRLNGDVITQHESVILLQTAEDFSLFEANIWGMAFYGTQIDVSENGNTGIHTYHFAGYILAALRHASQMLRFLGYTGPVAIELSVASILGVPWLTAPGGFLRSGSASELDDDVMFSIATSSDAMSEDSGDLTRAILRSAFYAVNLARFVDTDEKLEALRRQGFQYNFWPEPTVPSR